MVNSCGWFKSNTFAGRSQFSQLPDPCFPVTHMSDSTTALGPADRSPPIGSDQRLAMLTERLRHLAAELNRQAGYVHPTNLGLAMAADAAAVSEAADLLNDARAAAPTARLVLALVDPTNGAVLTQRTYAFDTRGELQPCDGLDDDAAKAAGSGSMRERIQDALRADSDAQLRNRMLTVPVSDDPQARALHAKAADVLALAAADTSVREDPPAPLPWPPLAHAQSCPAYYRPRDPCTCGATEQLPPLPADPPADPFAGERCVHLGCTAPVTSRVRALHYCTEHTPPAFPPNPRRA